MSRAPFLHELPDWPELLRVEAAERGLPASLVEKDYWIVHCLGAMQALGWMLHFKGGTSLSKGWGLIERFSEDLDLQADPPPVPWALAPDHNWKSEGKRALAARVEHFSGIERSLVIPGCAIARIQIDDRGRGLQLRAEYREAMGRLPPPLSAGVLLEFGRARVNPAESRSIESWVGARARRIAPGEYRTHEPLDLLCVRPEVTLLEKIDAIARRYPSKRPASAIIRHFEDCASILAWRGRGSVSAPLNCRALYADMRRSKDLTRDYAADSRMLGFADPDRNEELERAWQEMDRMHWGERRPFKECCAAIQRFVWAELGPG